MYNSVLSLYISSSQCRVIDEAIVSDTDTGRDKNETKAKRCGAVSIFLKS